jgi:hypothetical protein
MATFTIREDQADPLLMVLPLQGEVTRAVGDDLNASGHGKCCAGCDKPFTVARKQRAVGRMTHTDPDGRLFTTAWLFCGRCAAAIRRNGGRLPVHLVQEARDATSAGLLLAAPAEGSA